MSNASKEAPFPLYKNKGKRTFEEGFASVTSLLRGKKNILVLAGAGLSVSCGIPDFRSEDGLYSMDASDFGLSSPEELFDLETFDYDPAPFYKFFKTYFQKVDVKPSISHNFLALLDRNKMLRRIYTQNIDGLEEMAGVSLNKIVHAHGSLRYASCRVCRHRVRTSEIMDDIESGKVPLCKRQKETKKKKRKLNCGGVIKPGITFFGEKLGDEVGRSLEADYSKADAIIVIGTSLSVAPMNKIIRYFPCNIPRILINRNIVDVPQNKINEATDLNHNDIDFRDAYMFDVHLLGNCDAITSALMKAMDFILEENLQKVNTINHFPSACSIPLSLTDKNRNIIERTLLFHGAQIPEIEVKASSNSILDTLKCDQKIYCDACQQQILPGTKVMKCLKCFNFDLCFNCYSQKSKTHFNGKHRFIEDTNCFIDND